jgi:hypothetical protein
MMPYNLLRMIDHHISFCNREITVPEIPFPSGYARLYKTCFCMSNICRNCSCLVLLKIICKNFDAYVVVWFTLGS